MYVPVAKKVAEPVAEVAPVEEVAAPVAEATADASVEDMPAAE